MDGELLIKSVAGFFVGAGLFYQGFKWLNKKRTIENTPTSKIRSLAMGPVEIYGKVQAANPLIKAPFSGKDCVYYLFTAEKLVQTKNSSKWVLVKRGEGNTYFYMQDETGFVLVDPKGAECDLPIGFEFITNGTNGLKPDAVSTLSSNGVGAKNFLGFSERMRYREYVVIPDQNLYIMGTAGDNPFVEEGTAQTNAADIMIHKGENMYHISDKSEKEVLKKLKWKVIGGIFGGSALMLFFLALTLLQFV